MVASMRLAAGVIFLVVTQLLHAGSATPAATEVPVTLREGLLWIEVAVSQASKPLNFLVDTGASVSVLNLETAQRLGLKLGSKVSVCGVDSVLNGRWPVKLSAKANQIQLPSEYLALDLSKLSKACDRSVDGLVGADFFRNRIVQIDFKTQRIRLLVVVPTGKGENAIPLDSRRCGLRIPVNVNGHQRQWVRLDTGCATALQWVAADVPVGGCASKPAVGLSELLIPQTEVTIRLGNQRLDDVPTGLHREAIFPGEAGLLGNGVLARFGVITIDAKSHRLILGSPAAN